MTAETPNASMRLQSALRAPSSSDRLQSAMAAGTHPRPEYVEVLVERCAVEPDFSVREMLTWALLRHDSPATVDRLLRELGSAVPQARSQALHTLSKIGDRRAWSAISRELLFDDDDDVARAAWRAAAGLVPPGEAAGLADALATQFARGDRDVQRSLTRAFLMLGEAGSAAVAGASVDADAGVRLHAIATARLLEDPDEGFDTAMYEARRAAE